MHVHIQWRWLSWLQPHRGDSVSLFKSILYMPKLLAPSVLCTDTELQPEGEYLLQRTGALKAFMAYMSTTEDQFPNGLGADNLNASKHVREAMGRIITDYSELPRPQDCCGFGSLHALYEFLEPYHAYFWSFTSGLDDTSFSLYFAGIVWLTVRAGWFGPAPHSDGLFGSTRTRMIAHAAQGLYTLSNETEGVG